MTALLHKKNSPFYWIRLYDKTERDPKKKRKWVNTKIRLTDADLHRIKVSAKEKVRCKLKGNKEVIDLKNRFDKGLHELFIEYKTYVKLKKIILFSEVFREFREEKSLQGLDSYVIPRTMNYYVIAYNHFIKSCGDKPVDEYKDKDFIQFVKYLTNELSITKNSISFYSTLIKAIFNFAKSKEYISRHYIKSVKTDKAKPKPIPINEIKIIIDYVKEHYQAQYYQIILFMLLTGARPSSAVTQLRERIDLNNNLLEINNVKTGDRKGKQFYPFPIYKELRNLLLEMNVDTIRQGRLFDKIVYYETNYTGGFKFFNATVNILLKQGLIKEKYTLKQIRKTFATFILENSRLDIKDIKELLDHESIETTDSHYLGYDLSDAKDKFEEINLNFLNS